MGSIRVPKPGTQYGPCPGACEHTDCRASRMDSKMLCTICGKEIGYEVEFYNDGPGTQKHAACAYIKARKAQ